MINRYVFWHTPNVSSIQKDKDGAYVLYSDYETQQALLHQIFSDITKDNRLSPDTYEQLIEVMK